MSDKRDDPQSILSDQLNETMKRYGRDRTRHKWLALGLKISTSSLGAGATVLLGWQDPGALAATLKNTALVLTSLVTLFAAYDAFFEPRKLWVRETYVLNSLRDLERRWALTKAAGQADAASVAKYSDEFHAILKESLDEWMNTRQTAKA